MASLDFDISADDIQRQIVDAIAQSAIGAELQKIVAEEVAKLSRTSHDNPIRKVVQNKIESLVLKIISTEYGEQLEKFVAEQVTEEFTADMFNKMWDAFKNRY